VAANGKHYLDHGAAAVAHAQTENVVSLLPADLVWRETGWLWLAMFPWVLLLIRHWLSRSSARDYVDRSLLPWALARNSLSLRHHLLWRQIALAIAWLLFAMALAGPRYAQSVHDTDSRHYGQLILVVDLSRSMTADDIAPDRLHRIKLELTDLVRRVNQTRVGIVVYAARPHLLVPPTADKSLLRFYIQQLRHGLLPTEGSNLRSALEFATARFDPGNARSILVVSDGEVSNDRASSEPELQSVAAQIRQQGITVSALGVGTKRGAALLAYDGSWLYYENKPVVSRLNTDRLRRLTTAGGGRYSDLKQNDAEWRELYDQGIARQYVKHAIAVSRDSGLIVWREYYAWCLVPALLIWLVVYWRPRSAAGLPVIVAMAITFALMTTSSDLSAAEPDWQQRAYQAFNDESFEEAGSWYARVPGYAGRMGEGSSAYRQKEYRVAIRQFVRALLDANNDRQRADALFNLGNSYFQLGQYQDAANVYQDVLRYRPKDKNSVRNLAYANALIKKQQADRGTPSSTTGAGPRSVRPTEGSDISDAGIVLDTESRVEPDPDNQQQADQLQAQTDLVSRGFQRAELAATRIEESEDPDWTYDIVSVDGVALEADTIRVDESILWQRILEYEEEFPVLLETPQELPGVQPW
jgi:Ca-activated chloride channel family protein